MSTFERIRKAIFLEQENLLKEALDKHLGKEWTPEDIKTRCVAKYQHENVSYFVDDVCILRLGKVEFKLTDDYLMTWTREVYK